MTTDEQKASIDAQIAALKAQRAALDIPEDTKTTIAGYLKDSVLLAYIKAEIDKLGNPKEEVASEEDVKKHGPAILEFIQAPKTRFEIIPHMTAKGVNESLVVPLLRALKKAGKLTIQGKGAGRKYKAKAK